VSPTKRCGQQKKVSKTGKRKAIRKEGVKKRNQGTTYKKTPHSVKRRLKEKNKVSQRVLTKRKVK